MRKVFSLLAGTLLTIAFARIVVSVPHFTEMTIDWLLRWSASEKYLVIDNGWILSQQVFPHFGYLQVAVFYLLAITGFFVFTRAILRLGKKIWARLPVFRLRREFLVSVSAITIVAFVLGLALGLLELKLDRTSSGSDLLLGDKLKPISTWRQQISADDRGMCFMRQDFAWWDSLHHVNKQGFLSNTDYTKANVDSLRKSGKIIVLVIGDSFVEGFTTGTWDHSFGELLKKDMADKYAIFTFGIGGTDPLDYRLRIEKYVPELHPDQVILCFCGNNDIMEFDRQPTPYVPILWTVNETFFYSNLYNKVILPTPDSLYHYLANNTATNRASGWLLKWLCKKSHIVSFTYTLLHPWLPTLDGSADTCQASYRNLWAAKQTCLSDSVALQIVFIPDKDDLKKNLADYQVSYRRVFKDLLPEVLFPEGFTKKEFGAGNDIHFNDTGNRKFAAFLETILVRSGRKNPARIDGF